MALILERIEPDRREGSNTMIGEPTTISAAHTIAWDNSVINLADNNWTTPNLEFYGWSKAPEKDIEFENPEHQKHLLKGEKLFQCTRCGVKQWFPHNVTWWYFWCECTTVYIDAYNSPVTHAMTLVYDQSFPAINITVSMGLTTNNTVETS